jgi:Trk K+ transport system NAD-binding subunit
MSRPIVVCGLDQVSFRIVELLCDLREPVTVVARSARDEWIRVTRHRGVPVHDADPRDVDALIEAGLRDAVALIAATERDLDNLEIALDVQRFRPDLPVVMRLFDQQLAQQLETGCAIRRALAVSALAAPVFASAALGERLVGSFSMDGRLLLVGHLPDEATARVAGKTVREIARDHGMVTLSVRRAGSVEVVPPAATRIEATDHVTVLSGARTWHALTGGDGERGGNDSANGPVPGTAHRALAGIGVRLSPRRSWKRIRQVWRDAAPGLKLVFCLLLLLIVVSVGAFRYGMQLDWSDAIYFVVTTVTTTGYGDITPRASPVALKLYACLLMVLGSAAIATLYSIITDFIVTARFQQLLGQRDVPEENHVVVVGLGNVGYRVVEELNRAHVPVVAIEANAGGRFVESVRAHTPVILGDACLGSTLERASVARARAVVCVTSDDAINLSVSLAAEQMDPRVRTVVRWFDADLAEKVQRAVKVDAVMSSGRIAAPTFVAAALQPNVRQAFVLGDRLLAVMHRKVPDSWAGLTPADLVQAHQVTAVMHRPPGAAAYQPIRDEAALARGEDVLVVSWRDLVGRGTGGAAGPGEVACDPARPAA